MSWNVDIPRLLALNEEWADIPAKTSSMRHIAKMLEAFFNFKPADQQRSDENIEQDFPGETVSREHFDDILRGYGLPTELD